MSNTTVDVQKIASFIKSKYKGPVPKIGIVCGSGLSELTEAYMTDKFTLKYDDIPNFPKTTVAGLFILNEYLRPRPPSLYHF